MHKVSHGYLHADDFARSVDESLKTLGVDYVDLLLVHWPNLGFRWARHDQKTRQKGRGPRAISASPFQHRAARQASRCVRTAGDCRPSIIPSDRRRCWMPARAQAGLHRLLSARARAAVQGRCSPRSRQKGQTVRKGVTLLVQKEIVLLLRSSNSARLAETAVFDFAQRRGRRVMRIATRMAASPIRPTRAALGCLGRPPSASW